MIEVIQAAAELQAVCQSQGWQFCFIGGLALQRWGEPRETVDADMTILDWVDVERIIVRQTGKLDWNYIREQLRPLTELKESPEILDQLERRQKEFEE